LSYPTLATLALRTPEGLSHRGLSIAQSSSSQSISSGLNKEDFSKVHAALESHIRAIVRQEITTFFYLPKGALLPEDHIALLDRINNCDLRFLSEEFVRENRLFSLSNYGLYLFLLKISIHFTRITEGLDRG
jgi:hypothetical protein